MLDVHPPHTATHTWRDFLLHIATICVGLLIAVSLEQSVEAIHRARERKELREALAHESEQILKDTQGVDSRASVYIAWITTTEQQLSDASRLHRSPGPFAPSPSVKASQPDDPIFRAAAAGSQLALLSRPEVEAFSEVHQLVTVFGIRDQETAVAVSDFANFRHADSFAKLPGTAPFADASPQDLKTAYDLLGREERAITLARRWARTIEGAENAICNGERDLQKIEAAEGQFRDTPSPPTPTEKK
jgi:type II secretory pathway pseudopilin PulG